MSDLIKKILAARVNEAIIGKPLQPNPSWHASKAEAMETDANHYSAHAFLTMKPEDHMKAEDMHRKASALHAKAADAYMDRHLSNMKSNPKIAKSNGDDAEASHHNFKSMTHEMIADSMHEPHTFPNPNSKD